MEEIEEMLAWLLIAILLIVAIIYILVYLVLPCAICYYLGQKFYRQMKMYELGTRAKAALAGMGFASIAIALAIVSSQGYESIVIVPISALLFLTASILMLSSWGYFKKKRFIDMLDFLYARRFEIDARIRQNSQALERLKKNNEEIQSTYRGIMMEKEKNEGHLRELCEEDARTYTIKRREWISFFKSKSDRDLDKLEQELVTYLKRVNRSISGETIENAIKLCIAKIERLNRIIAVPASELSANSLKIKELMSIELSTRQEAERLKSKIHKNEADYAAFTNARILLD